MITVFNFVLNTSILVSGFLRGTEVKMELNHIEQKHILEQTVSYQQFVRWSSEPIHLYTNRNSYAYQSEWSYPPSDMEETFTIQELTKININPELLFGTFIREQIFPDSFIHKLAVTYCEDFLERLENQNIKTNPRFHKIINIKKLWLKKHATSRDLDEVKKEAHRIFANDEKTQDIYYDSLAYAVYSCTIESAVQSIRGVFKASERVFDEKLEYRRRWNIFLKLLGVQTPRPSHLQP